MNLERELAAGADLLGWLALADLCEERGDSAAAELWRRRAGCLRGVLALRAVAARGQSPALRAYDLSPGWCMEAYCTPRQVRATLLRYAYEHIPPLVAGRYHLPRASLLGQTQRDTKVAALYLRRKALEWADIIGRRRGE